MAATPALREALNRGISSGNLVDTKIIVYSHRDSSGRVCRPKALYTNNHVLKTVPYFNDLLFGNFTESKSKDFKETIDEEDSAEDYGYLSDSDLEDNEDEKSTPFKRRTKSKTHPFDRFVISDEDRRTPSEESEEHIEKGKVVKIPDMAFVTFQAFLMYLYTNVIEFAPFGSEGNRRSRSAEIVTSSHDKAPRPSPKSIYRLADKYDVPALKTLALDHIRGELGKCDIVEETFSRFASRHEKIRGLYIEQLAYAWKENSTMEATGASVDEKVESFTEGDLEYAAETLSALWEIANKDGDIKAPASTSSAPTQPTSHARWAAVNIALIKSIRKGVFFDRKYWAIHSKAGDVLKPVYFSSIIMGDKARQVNGLMKYLKGQRITMNDLEGDLNVESDCECDSMEVELEAQTTEEKKEELQETRAVLFTGSFSAWKSLFFYCCTDTISFAPLKSQGVDSRLEYIRENTVADAPPPCSPKSIYVLAELLELKPLCESALADIKTKISADNVVDETFSWVTAGHNDVHEMQCDLLISNFKNPKTIALVKENIEHTSDGSLPHRADSLKLALKKAFKYRNGVKLQCYNSSCSRHHIHLPRSSTSQSDNRCSACGSKMECVGCRADWHGDPSCRRCGKNHI